MNTKKQYMQPEMNTIVLSMPSALLAGSTKASVDNPTGTDWNEEIED